MNSKERAFVKTVKSYYKRHGRLTLPWRKTKDPYKILVSEVMLQQTQVDRVIPKYKDFLKRFPEERALARSSLAEVLQMWQGLGYNRRAKHLHACVKVITQKGSGRIPLSYEELVTLPGIGAYTASAIMAFAYNEPVIMIETNIRAAYLHHFFSEATDVHDAEIVRYIALTLDKENPREWYWALMDYGAHIKKAFGNPNSRSKHYVKQSAFNGSDRQIRGAIIRLLAQKSTTREKLHTALFFEKDRIDAQIERLLKEGMILRKHWSYTLPE